MDTQRINYAFITGITGQDGSYLAEYLLSKNYKVIGLTRKNRFDHMQRIQNIISKVQLLEGDLLVEASIYSNILALKKIIQDEYLEIYHLAAQSDVATSFRQPVETQSTNAKGTLLLLQAFRDIWGQNLQNIKFYNAATSELFGDTPGPQNEQSKFNPQSPYAIAKQSSFQYVELWRKMYGLYAVNGILFNHESPRRPENFILKKIIKGAVCIQLKRQEYIELGNLNAKRDIGYAGDYVQYMHQMLQFKEPTDLVIGTGKSHSIRQMVEEVFAHLNIQIGWRGEKENEVGYDKKDDSRVLIKVNKEFLRPLDVEFLQADTTKAQSVLDLKDMISFQNLIEIMLKDQLDNEKK